jgi:PKD repeat protein
MGRAHRFFGARTAVVAIAALLAAGLTGLGAPAGALTSTTQPTLTLNRLIRTSPFTGSSTTVRDNEDLAYVPSDDSLWMADDNGNAVYEINRTTGALKRTVSQTTFINSHQFGGSALATKSRNEDIEAVAYDRNADILYVFSGSTSSTPTVYRFLRDSSHNFQIDSWQPLPTEWTGAGWRLADGKLYVADASAIRTYDYVSNAFGPSFSVSGLSTIYDVAFDPVTGDMLAVSKAEKLFRVNMTTHAFTTGWGGLDLTKFGMKDTRGVEVIGEQVFVSDGYDYRSSSDPMNHAIFVFDVTGPSSTPPPTASFTASPTSGTAPLGVTFTDTSTGTPTSWAWTFGDGGTSTSQNPTHTYLNGGTYTATLTATNGGGSTSASTTISVSAAPVKPTASFTESPSSGTAPLSVQFTDTSTGAPTSWAWDFGDGNTSTAQSPSHIFTANGTYTVQLTATNLQGSDSTTRSVTVSDAPPPPTTVPLDADTYFNTSSPTKNYGAYTLMKLHSPTTAEYRPLVKFTLSGFAGPPTSVKLHLYVIDGSDNCGSWYSVSNSWTESTVTWNTKPDVSGTPAGTAGACTTGQWVDVDVTSAVTGNGTYSFEATSGSTNTAEFSSREGTNAPQVLIVP